ncbi:helix-turn-helix domain-containing protein [Streptomyces sp. JW3]|uniref:helix-turn-helix domain-containing protein n=1 Tax=Streptomyces sp. JW3 TaxID=3456955 RepID=UPI003FA42DCC
MTDPLPHSLRSAARDNRDRVLDAARALFASRGLDVPMREVARHAGVGPATLYRRFPTKRDLATAAFVSACPEAVDLADGRAQTLRAVAALARRAKEAGRLRPDFALDDLILVLMANRGIQAPTRAAGAAASRRFAAFVIQAFQASPDHAPLPPVPRLVGTE